MGFRRILGGLSDAQPQSGYAFNIQFSPALFLGHINYRFGLAFAGSAAP